MWEKLIYSCKEIAETPHAFCMNLQFYDIHSCQRLNELFMLNRGINLLFDVEKRIFGINFD